LGPATHHVWKRRHGGAHGSVSRKQLRLHDSSLIDGVGCGLAVISTVRELKITAPRHSLSADATDSDDEPNTTAHAFFAAAIEPVEAGSLAESTI
jgi:hypothetical protein